MKMTKEMKDYVRNEITKEMKCLAEKKLPDVKRKHAEELSELEQIEKDEAELNNKRRSVIKRLQKGDTAAVRYNEYLKGFEVASYSDIEEVTQRAILKLQYEATDISDVGEIVRKVVAEFER